jgi:hypothetical protein
MEKTQRTQTGVAAAEAVCDSHLLCPTGQTTEPEDQQQWQFNFVGSTCKRERVLELCCYFSFGPTCLLGMVFFRGHSEPAPTIAP